MLFLFAIIAGAVWLVFFRDGAVENGSPTPDADESTAVAADTRDSDIIDLLNRRADTSDEIPAVVLPPEPAPTDTTSDAARTIEPIPSADETPDDSPPPPQTSTSPATIRAMVADGSRKLAAGELVEARALFNRALHDPRTTDRDQARLRDRLTELNQTLVFEPVLMPTDPYFREYILQPGDALSRVVRRENVSVHSMFLQRINQISNPRTIRAGQSLKLPTGVFHAIIYKAQYRLDLYMDAPGGADWMYVRSFGVGLGEYDSTPVGSWVVTPDRKMTNPEWHNPRTGEYFAPDDPNNPIGEYWLPLTGTDPNTQVRSGYGIHGTIEPESIGRAVSMGCVRMLPADVAIVWEALAEGKSTVEIQP
ncbi:MAG: L,D-transpeptidase family protein [Phycisphaerales bacterium]|nr:L,D-transpeptidase family protein [Phycisphaerales bacterium]